MAAAAAAGPAHSPSRLPARARAGQRARRSRGRAREGGVRGGRGPRAEAAPSGAGAPGKRARAEGKRPECGALPAKGTAERPLGPLSFCNAAARALLPSEQTQSARVAQSFAFHIITEAFGLDKSSEVIESNQQPNTTGSSRPWHSECHIQSFLKNLQVQ